MGEGDTTAKEFLDINENFADCINYAVFNGQNVVQSTELSDLDKEEIIHAMRRSHGMFRGCSRLRSRDLLRRVHLKECQGVKYMIVGVENQCSVDCGMAVRCMQYDALRYERQMRGIVVERRKCQSRAGRLGTSSGGKWSLPTLPHGELLEPVITIVVYWGRGRWDGPRSLHELLACRNRRILDLVADYRLNLVEPYAMDAKDFALFKTEVGAVLNYVSVQDDPDAMEKLLQEDGRFRDMSPEALQLLQTVTKTSIRMPKQEGRVDMCKAEKILMERARQRGMKDGLEKGLKDGLEKGIMGAIEMLLEVGKSVADIHAALMRQYSLDADEASRYLALKGLSL